MLIDATNMIVGRLGSIVAKKALLGEKIDIINAENAVISGRKKEVLARFRQKASRGTWAKGPHFKRAPDMILKRMLRGMLPYKQEKGRTAMKRIVCWQGVPDEFKAQKTTTFKEADASNLSINKVSIKEISKFLGGNVD